MFAESIPSRERRSGVNACAGTNMKAAEITDALRADDSLHAALNCFFNSPNWSNVRYLSSEFSMNGFEVSNLKIQCPSSISACSTAQSRPNERFGLNVVRYQAKSPLVTQCLDNTHLEAMLLASRWKDSRPQAEVTTLEPDRVLPPLEMDKAPSFTASFAKGQWIVTIDPASQFQTSCAFVFDVTYKA